MTTVQGTLNQSNILIVDDNPTNIQVLFEVLRASNYRMAMAKSGEIALKRLEQNLPDLILLDVMMPGIDGFETCRRLKASEDTRDIPIIFMTALSDPVDKAKGLSLGAVDYITKPIQQAEVLARIQIHLKLHHLTQTLEEKVKQRTTDLTQTLNHLQEAQIKLIQSEKMSGLGQLVAGIAHEINNPVNFIYANLTPAEDYMTQLLQALALYQEAQPNLSEESREILEDLDIDFIQEDAPKLLSSMRTGAEWIRQIVLSLRNFSRIEESDFKAVDIHHGLESTLMILNHRFKARPERPAIEIIQKYGTLPEIECYSGSLNQVFMNLLSNAIDALEESNVQRTYQEIEKRPNRITIDTSQLDQNWVQITIADNGIGISESIQSKIFDPFFTTKPMGKGTGMGMAISHQIITEQHGGKLDCLSVSGKGTKFVIQIPIQQRDRK